MPFKWNATRVQVLPNQVVQLNVQQANNNRPPLGQQRLAAIVAQSVNMNTISNMANSQIAFSNVATQQGRWQQEMAVMESLGQQRLNIQLNNQQPWIQEMDYNDIIDNKGPRMANMARRHSPPLRRDRDRERDTRREERRERYRERERYSPPPVRKRSRSPRRPSRSPPRRRQRIVPRYTVQIPKISLDLKTGNVMELRKRYSNLYIPSDFCAANFLWQDAFPPNRPFMMDHQCNFHIVGKDVEPLFENDAVLEPSDADWSYSAKVMLMSLPSLTEIFHKSCALAQDGDDLRENFVHPTRLISFLVGLKGKNETVAIGGPWSPSLDGPNPDTDPSVLVKTAIRTCQSLTGIDLSKCSQWYRFAEIYYRRGDSSSHKSRGTRVETVVLFMPDVWSCLPTRVEWDGMIAAGTCKKPLLQRKVTEETSEPDAQEEEKEEGAMEVDKNEPTHYSELDPKSIKVIELKRELEARNLSAKGLKSQLVLRLTNALKIECEKDAVEKTAETADDESEPPAVEEVVEETVEDDKKKEKENDKKKDEKEKSVEKLNFPDSPAIIVQPSKTAKSGKFDCTVMSLSLLLDYRQEDNKEHSFEVSLFAEIFNEMMMRDFGFRIYRALIEAPEIKDDDKDKKKDKKDRKDDKDDNRRKEDADIDSDRDEDDSDDDECDGDDKRDKDRKKKRKKRPQMMTYDPYLLLSFVYYDQTHCGYLLDKDIEEIFYTLGLMLSRAQVRKLIQKVCKREIFRYRKLTDKPVDADKPQKLDIKSSLEELATGNKKYIPMFKSSSNESSDDVSGKVVNGSKSSLVSFNGALVDVAKLMEQLSRSEKARLEADDKLKNLEQDLESLNEVSATKEKQAQKLSQNLEEQSKKLKITEEDLKKMKVEADRYHKALSNIRDGLHSTCNIAESALLRGKSRSARSSPLDRRDSDSDSSSQGNKNKIDAKVVEKETNGVSNGECETLLSDVVQVKSEKDPELMNTE